MELDLNNPKFLEEFCNHVVIAKLIADELADDNSYQQVVNLADKLNISVSEVNAYMQLYKYVQKQMII